MSIQILNPVEDCLNCLISLEEGDVLAIVSSCVVALSAFIIRKIDLRRIRRGKKPLFQK